MDVYGYLQQIDEGARRLSDSAEWKRWLDYQRRFHAYSAGNCWLIVAQKPTATQVASFGTWKAMGRWPRPKTGIHILAPHWTKHTNADGEEVGRLGFHAACVFDVSDTEGEPLPEPTERIATSDRADLYTRLVAVAESLGYTVGLDDTGAAGGWVDYGRKIITLAEDAALDQRVKTVVHELAHVLCDHKAQSDQESRAQQELEAESVAYCLCAEAGLDTGGYSFAYVQSWAGEGKDVLKALKGSADTIAKAVKRLWEMVESQVEVEAVAVAA